MCRRGRKRSAKLGYLQVRVISEPPPGLLQHPGAFIEAGHDGAPVAQHRQQRTCAAASIEDPPPGHVSGEGQHRGPLVIGIDEAGLVFGRVRLGEAVVVVEPRLTCRHIGRRDEPGGDPPGGLWSLGMRPMLACTVYRRPPDQRPFLVGRRAGRAFQGRARRERGERRRRRRLDLRTAQFGNGRVTCDVPGA